MPANVSVNARATVTAGFANDVEAVNQYARDDVGGRQRTGRCSDAMREQPQITAINPNVATNSLNSCGAPARTCCESCSSGSPNIT